MMMNAENEGAIIDFPLDPALRYSTIQEEGRIHFTLGSKPSEDMQFVKCIHGFLIPASAKTLGHEESYGKKAPLVIETIGFLPNARGIRSLQMLMCLKERKSDKEISQSIQFSNLSPYIKKHICDYALAIRQRLSIASMIVRNHSLFILQNPFDGLDHQGVLNMQCLMRQMRAAGKTLYLASPHSPYAQLSYEEICVIEEGKIVFFKSFVV